MEKCERIKNETVRKESDLKINFYTLVWAFVTGCVLGYCYEITWYFFKEGHFVNRQGVIYGPFNQIYGFGFVVLVLLLYRIRKMRGVIIMLASAVLGTVFEYGSSVLLEKFFKYTSWDYSNFPFNLNGRVNLINSLIWGFYGYISIKYIYPYVCSITGRLSKKRYVALTWAIFLFLVFDIGLSALAQNRQRERSRGIAPSGSFEIFLDEHYPDERLNKIYNTVEYVE